MAWIKNCIRKIVNIVSQSVFTKLLVFIRLFLILAFLRVDFSFQGRLAHVFAFFPLPHPPLLEAIVLVDPGVGGLSSYPTLHSLKL